MDPSVPSRGFAFEYQLNGALTNGTPFSSNLDSAIMFIDDVLTVATKVRRVHFNDLRTAVNLLRAQAGLSAFQYDSTYFTSNLIRASHVLGLRTALTQARQQLGTAAATFPAVSVGSPVRAVDVQGLRDLAR
jgi:hypothetical protein